MSASSTGQRVVVLGAGAIGLGYVALLAGRGHRPVLWSPSGRGLAPFADGAPLVARGKLEAELPVELAPDGATALAGAAAVVVALPGPAQQAALDALAPHLWDGQLVLFSAHLSLAGLYLAKLLHARGIEADIAAWSSPALTARRPAPGVVEVSGLREGIEMAAVPACALPRAMALATTLFGPRFVTGGSLLGIDLGNINPVAHLANALCNFTRIERGEDWGVYEGVTAFVARLTEALDAERRAIAAGYDEPALPIAGYYAQWAGLPEGSLAELCVAIHARRRGPPGPRTTDTRFVLEDVPFGIVPWLALARLAGIPVPVMEGGVALCSALYGRDFARENGMLQALALETAGEGVPAAACRHGWAAVAEALGPV